MHHLLAEAASQSLRNDLPFSRRDHTLLLRLHWNASREDWVKTLSFACELSLPIGKAVESFGQR